MDHFIDLLGWRRGAGGDARDVCPSQPFVVDLGGRFDMVGARLAGSA